MSGSPENQRYTFNAKTCSCRDKHQLPTPQYLSDEFLLRKLATHEQTRCPECGLYVMWTRLPKRRRQIEVAALLACGNETAEECLARIKEGSSR